MAVVGEEMGTKRNAGAETRNAATSAEPPPPRFRETWLHQRDLRVIHQRNSSTMPIPFLGQIYSEGIGSVPYLSSALRFVPWAVSVGLLKLYFSGSSNNYDRVMHSRVAIVTVGRVLRRGEQTLTSTPRVVHQASARRWCTRWQRVVPS